ncbi:hypothetical protein CXG81DRAFT_18331 [Caulochytrium protostelioides]|uniref:LIM zinc-binding domain-containing protein n=1 Tax=Caulochytrium protostelioides TaxID=1555241 RepID=A0A4P9X9J7_9FUNG|nr:hypothetical protein CXG81DRAFT_18331 [Caulochytrium protostelioides]|eukprot:RKP01975.1 hypothetical protein CXG81DRAFT_18331 [Caulochytrium protostelioides]
MPFCPTCGEIVRSPTGTCTACSTPAVDSATSGLTASDNQGGRHANAYLSGGFRSGVETGLSRMLGRDGAARAVNEPCVECHRPLRTADEVFVAPDAHGGHTYCESCYAARFALGPCATCHRPVLGMGRPYVKEPAPGPASTGAAATTTTPPRVWHRDCYQGTSCHVCHAVILGEAVSALGQTYHPACFQCVSCHTPFAADARLTDLNGDPCCVACATRIAQSAARADPGPRRATAAASAPADPADREIDAAFRRPLALAVCEACGIPVNGGLRRADGTVFHDECLVCGICEKPLTAAYVADTTPAGQGAVYHPACAPKMASAPGTMRCGRCRKPLTKQYIKLDDALYHPECFTCDMCRTPLTGGVVELQNKTVCEPCAKQARAAPAPMLRASDGPAPRSSDGAGCPGSSISRFPNPRVGAPAPAPAPASASAAGSAPSGGKPPCPACGRPTYMDGIPGPGPGAAAWHKACLRCRGCATQLDSGARLRDTNAPYCLKCAMG